jgi:LacI family transcriptional regulator
VTITIREVAKQAGVSVATVSRVMNNSGPVSAATRERVERVAAALRYAPHGGARGLILRRTRTIGVILPDLYGEYFSEVIRGMDQATQRAGYNVLLSSSHEDRSEIDAAVRAMRGRVDGLILMSPDIGVAELSEAVWPSLPVVLLNTEAGEAAGGFHTINVDNYGGSYAMVRHLASLGHTRIGLIGGDAGNHDARERRRGYEAALGDAGLEVRGSWQVESDFRKSGGWEAVRVLMRGRERPTAIFAANDAMAVGAMSALQEMGLWVPRDVAVTGFDDVPLARYVSPPLTSVHVDNSGLGARAVELLLASIMDAELEPRHEVESTTLVIRRSCGAPVQASSVEGVGIGG